NAQLALLRADFGRDLRRLSAAERSGLDNSCSAMNTATGREKYLDCLNQQLVMLRSKRKATRTAAAGAPAEAPPAPAAAPADAPPPHRDRRSSRASPPPPSPSSRRAAWCSSGCGVRGTPAARAAR